MYFVQNQLLRYRADCEIYSVLKNLRNSIVFADWNHLELRS